MKYIFIALVVACTDASDLSVGETVVRDCGGRPPFPGQSSSHEIVNGFPRTCMIDSDFAAVERWRADLETWAACVVGHP